MSKKVYILEDDVNFLYSLQAKLSIFGFLVKTDFGNTDINTIMKEIKNNKSDFIILDLILPRVEGISVLKALKSDEETSSLPVFVFTNMADKDSREKCLSLGASHVFSKGELSVDDLVEKIKKIFENKEKI